MVDPNHHVLVLLHLQVTLGVLIVELFKLGLVLIDELGSFSLATTNIINSESRNNRVFLENKIVLRCRYI